MSASGKNMEAIYKAKQYHDDNCPYGGKGVRVYMCPYDIDRMGWEEGDNIAGMTLISEAEINPGMLRIECDAELGNEGETLTETVSKEDLVPV